MSLNPYHQDFNAIEEQPPARTRGSLSELEDQAWNWSTIRTLITSGTGFFTDAYDVFIINPIVPMLCVLQGQWNHIPASTEGVLKGMASFGLVGQLVFCYLGDAVGRKRYTDWSS